MFLRLGSRRVSLLTTLILAFSIGVPTGASAAAPRLSSLALSVSVSDHIVTVSTKIAASPATRVGAAGVCARSSSGARRDFVLAANVTLTAGGTTITGYQALPTGHYTYFSCAKIGAAWHNIGAWKSFTVSAMPVNVAAPMPVGNLPHFQQIFTDDFSTDLPEGSFPGVYARKWMSYNGFADDRNKGDFNQKIISMHNGLMDLHIQVKNGRVQGAAPVPLINGGKWGGQTYGKYTVRFRADSLRGVGAAWLLWPDSNKWSDGEIDFPEGSLDGSFWAFDHCVGNPSVNCAYLNTQTGYTGWHTTSIEWTPQSVKFILDGVTLLTSTWTVPRTPMHWVLQTTSNADTATKGGHIYVDWVSVYRYVA